jgi:hypothetical protein
MYVYAMLLYLPVVSVLAWAAVMSDCGMLCVFLEVYLWRVPSHVRELVDLSSETRLYLWYILFKYDLYAANYSDFINCKMIRRVVQLGISNT